MRFKTLGIVMVSAMALFTAFYWITDPARRDTRYEDQFAELLAYGEEIFAPDNLIYDVTVSAAGFDPATITIEVNATIQFVSTLGSEITVRGAGAHAFELPVKAGAKVTSKFSSDGVTRVTADGVSGSLEVTAGPEVLNDSAANCAKCHGADGRSTEEGTIGPNLHSLTILDKLKAQAGGAFTAVRRPGDAPDYVNLVIRFGGVVVSGRVDSLMPAWSIEAGGSLTVHQVDALTALVETWVLEAAAQPQESAPEIPDTVAAGQKVYTDAGCAGCHAADLSGGFGPNLQNIGNEPVIDLQFPISQLPKLQADYAADPRAFLEDWIRDSAANYNDGATTNMPAHPVSQVSESAMRALITFLLAQTQ